MADNSRSSVLRLVLVPSLITLAVTIVRLAGELQNWSPVLFRRSAGGGGAIVGIVWLVPVFGIYFALKLSGGAEGPSSAAKSIGFALLGLIVLVIGGAVGFSASVHFPGKYALIYILMAAGAALVFPGWPELWRALVAYAYAARIPVALVMFFAMRGRWGTHYDALPPQYAGLAGFWQQYLRMAVLPQLILWVSFTIVVGALFGTVVAAIARAVRPADPDASE
jgi:hypothetical protein